MPARSRDTATKEQAPFRAIQNDLARSRRSKVVCLGPIFVNEHADSRNSQRVTPEISFHPIVSKAMRLHEHNVGVHATLAVGHELVEFFNAGARTRALRMDEHN